MKSERVKFKGKNETPSLNKVILHRVKIRETEIK